MRSPKDKMWSGTSLPSMSMKHEMSISPTPDSYFL